MEKAERFRGCLLGLAVGDALGTTLEFKPPGTFKPITDMVGGGPFNLEPGQWTDDTSMALCLAESLVECRGFNPKDQMERYIRWWREGYLSSTGTCFDIGNTTRTALAAFLKTGNPYSGPTEPRTAGNGSLMRLGTRAHVLRRRSEGGHRKIRREFTDDPRGQGMRRRLPAISAASWRRPFRSDKRRAPLELLRPDPRFRKEHPLVPEIEDIARGSYKEKNPPEIRGTGYVVQSLETAPLGLP